MPPKGYRKATALAEAAAQAEKPLTWSDGVTGDTPIESLPEHRILSGTPTPDDVPPTPVPGARKPVSGLSSNLDAVARGRIGAVNDVTIMCRAGGKRFDFKAMWLKKFPAEIPVFDKTPQFVEAVRDAGEIWINCKTRRANNMEVTVDHSRHEALWLKEFV